MALRNALTEEERYDAWAVNRIMKGKKCHVEGYLRCIPSRAKDCKICYEKDIAEMIKASQYKQHSFPT